MTLAIFQNDRVYEGNSRLLNAIYPMPSLSRGYRQLNEYGVDGEVIAEQVDCP